MNKFSLLDSLLKRVDSTSTLSSNNKQYQNEYVPLRHVIQQQYQYYFHIVHQSISSFEHCFSSSSSFYLSTRYLCLLSLESSVTFHLVSEFTVSRSFLNAVNASYYEYSGTSNNGHLCTKATSWFAVSKESPCQI